MKRPKPDKLVVTEGIPITVHSAGQRQRQQQECYWPENVSLKAGLLYTFFSNVDQNAYSVGSGFSKTINAAMLYIYTYIPIIVIYFVRPEGQLNCAFNLQQILFFCGTLFNYHYRNSYYYNYNTQVYKVTWSVAPWFVIWRKHSQMTATYKLTIIHGKKRADGGEKFRMENNLQGEQQKLSEREWI